MKKMVKTLIFSLFCLSLILAGCTNSKGNGDQAGSPNASNGGNAGNAGENAVSEPGSYPIVKDKITLRVMAAQIPQVIDFNTNEFTKWYEERTNIHVEWEIVPPGNVKEKLNLVLASGDYPDIFLGLGVDDVIEAQYGVGQQVFRPLDGLIEQNMAAFKDVLQKHPAVKGRITATDGNIYSLPTWNDCFHCGFAQKMWINQEWLDNLGLQMPTTTDEFYQVMKAFKEKDPNGNGKADEIPLAGATDGWYTTIEGFLMSSFILHPGMYNPLKMIVQDGKVMSIVNTPEYKEGLAYLNKLYAEGLIYQPSFTQKIDQLKSIAANEDSVILGAFPTGASVGVIDSATNQERYKQYVTVPPLEGPDGTRQAAFFQFDAAQGGDLLISSSSKYPEAAIRWADGLYEFETQYRMISGPKDIGWTTPDPGAVGLNGEPALLKRLKPYTNEPQNDGWMHAGVEYAPAEWRLGEQIELNADLFSPEGLERLLYEETAKNYQPYAPENTTVMPPVKLLAEENDELQTIRIELENYINESSVRFITGDLKPEADWDNYVQSLDNIGLKRFVEISQRAYDRQYAGK
ncbi:ABC transporter substrate-binding protein [Paenibacillus sp. PAMC21692]|uniref:ABC transporter substrate-binding protein n=1 Tax=Paenibacillus sp. PAMC21692 TaxID=2762320 RepID=UPI00164DC45B|nr:ABC transporter substrate-binding protein [Paenibacillus sp. PAMC21692]QNK58224.1 extracellular solute-binding protein [Paenibacillus sp. PAMC21692]